MTITNKDVENVRAQVSQSKTFEEYCEGMHNLEEIVMRQSRERSNTVTVRPITE